MRNSELRNNPTLYLDLELINLVENISTIPVVFKDYLTLKGIGKKEFCKIEGARNLNFLFAFEGIPQILNSESLITYERKNKSIYSYNYEGLSDKIDCDLFLPSTCIFENNLVGKSFAGEIIRYSLVESKAVWKDTSKTDDIDGFLTNGNFIIYKSDKNNIFCRDFNSGQFLWEYSVSDLGKHFDIIKKKEVDGSFGGDFYLTDNKVIFTVRSNKVVALNLADGSLAWQVSLEGLFCTASYDPKGYIFAFESFYTDEDGVIFNLYKIDAEKGSIIRKENIRLAIEKATQKKITHMDYGGIALSADDLFISILEERVIVAIDKESFEIKWNFVHDGPISAQTPVISNNRLFIRDQASQLLIFQGQ